MIKFSKYLSDVSLTPIFSIFESMSPIKSVKEVQFTQENTEKDSSDDTEGQRILQTTKFDPQISKYMELRRGTRGQLINSNSSMFILSGSNFVLVMIYLFCLLLLNVSTVNNHSQSTNKKRSLLSKIVIWIAKLFKKILFIRLLIISMTEITVHDISKDQSLLFYISYTVSLVFLGLACREIQIGYSFLMEMKNEKFGVLKEAEGQN